MTGRSEEGPCHVNVFSLKYTFTFFLHPATAAAAGAAGPLTQNCHHNIDCVGSTSTAFETNISALQMDSTIAVTQSP